MNAEFDHYIKNYRKNCDSSLSLSGESSAFFAEYKVQKLQEWFPQKKDLALSILDFGCGDGLMTSYIKHYFPYSFIYGVDPSSKSINNAQQQFPDIQFSTNSEHNTVLDFKDSMFDITTSAGTFHHIPRTMHKDYVQEVHRITKNNGMFILFELNPLNPLTVVTFKRNPIDAQATMMTPWYSYKLVKKIWKNVEIKFYCFYPNFLQKLRPTEKYLTKVPFGSLYAIIAHKNV